MEQSSPTTQRCLLTSPTYRYSVVETVETALRVRQELQEKTAGTGRRGRRGIQESKVQGAKGEQGSSGPASGGVTYIRWVKTTCPSVPGTALVYHGMAAGSWFGDNGGGANYLCMPYNPQYSNYLAGVQGYSPLHGTEYQLHGGPLSSSAHNHNVPCAVCYVSTRVSSLMLPARMECQHLGTLNTLDI